ncbi:hypothetical protein [Leptothoe spongobia]|uniref:Peptidase C-terminal archaeal/bacterial domain-containing protein n=1 Tax=Leptothoe spongobia TAU-MAC 1115 TaxID=1967444 RepID=A0A947DG37_9CYAN|nr:hypothetical protein [Leptothoe spongobia]MBT9315276.1 hypothetical protein [Leptothoe spongobia TAU-MAC 1115]
MMRLTSIVFLATGLVTLLSGCGATTVNRPEETVAASPISQNASEPAAPETNAPATDSTTPLASTQKIALDPSPDPYCYTFDDGIITTHLRLTIHEDNQLQGDARSTVQNDEAAYYTSYTQAFSGPLINNQANVDITTWIEFDVQASRETWTLTQNTLQTKDYLLDLTNCELVDPVFQDEDGLEASDLMDWASAVHTERVEFSPGESSATVSNSVIRGERDVYILGASGGQQMELSIESLEDNAVFDVISPSQLILAREAMDETIYLPHTGDYRIIVGGTRGNASYHLTIGIQ